MTAASAATGSARRARNRLPGVIGRSSVVQPVVPARGRRGRAYSIPLPLDGGADGVDE